MSPAEVGQTITYTYRVTNSGNLTLSLITASDDELGAITLGLTTLTSDQGTTGSLTYTVVEGDLPGPLTNTVIVSGTPPFGSPVTATANEAVNLPSSPAITVAKQVNVSPAEVGQTITYTYRVTNTGNVTLDPVSASDDQLGAITLGLTTLAPDQGTTGSLTYTVVEGDLPGPLTNTVIVSGTPPVGSPVTATDTATIEVVVNLYLPIIFKNAVP